MVTTIFDRKRPSNPNSEVKATPAKGQIRGRNQEDVRRSFAVFKVINWQAISSLTKFDVNNYNSGANVRERLKCEILNSRNLINLFE